MKKIFTLLFAFIVATCAMADGIQRSQRTLPTVSDFDAYYYGTYTGIVGDWVIALYNSTSQSPVAEIDLCTGEAAKIAGKYTLSASDYENCVTGSGFAAIPEGTDTITYVNGTLDISYVKTETYPYYQIKGSISDDADNTMDIDVTLPCVSAMDYYLYYLYYYGYSSEDYNITLLDDPNAHSGAEPTGEVVELNLTSQYNLVDNTNASSPWWQIVAYSEDGNYYASFSPNTASSVAGEYTMDDMLSNYTAVVHYPSQTNQSIVYFTSGTIVVTEDNGSAVLDADMMGKDGVEYKIHMADGAAAGINAVTADAVSRAPRKMFDGRRIVIEKDGKTFGTDGVLLKK